MRTLEKMELGIYFHIGTKPFEEEYDDEAEYAVAKAAAEAIYRNLRNVPGASILLDNRGYEVAEEGAETSRNLWIEMCEFDGANQAVNGRLAFSIHFVAGKEISLPVAKALKDLCHHELAVAGTATNLLPTYAMTKVFRTWQETEEAQWAEI